MTSAAPSAGAIAMPRADADDPPSHRWGPLPYRLSSAFLAGTFLVYGVIEASSVAMDQLFGHIGDPSQSLAAVPVFVGLTALGLLPTVVYLHGLQTSPDLRRGRAMWKHAEDRASGAAMSRVHSQDQM